MENLNVEQTIDLSQINSTGIRIITLFSLLLDSPKSAEELNNYFIDNPLIKTTFSDDTIRNDINTLRNCGCKISRAAKTNFNRYVLTEHPFELNLKHAYVDSLKRGYKKIYQKLNFDELLELESLFEKFAVYTKNPAIKEKLLNISALRLVNKDILKELLSSCHQKQQVKILYKSAGGNEYELDLICDDIAFRNDKLYLFAYDVQKKKNCFYKFRNILKYLSVNLFSKNNKIDTFKAIYKIVGIDLNEYILSDDEKIMKTADKDFTIEAETKNEFIMMQNILRKGRNCVVLEPLDFREKVIKKIKEIRGLYD